MAGIISLDEALELVKVGYKDNVKRVWLDFVEYSGNTYENESPTEGDLKAYFCYLRQQKKMASSSLWTYYSMVNTVVRNRYSLSLQQYPRLTTLLKSFDTDIKKKAKVFETDDVVSFVRHSNQSPYWLVRKVIIIIAFFGGLRHTELMEVMVEKIESKPEGLFITHERAKQRSDKRQSKFLVPRTGSLDYASVVEEYIAAIKSSFGVYTGRLFYTGTPNKFVCSFMGKNMVSKVPNEMATLLKKEDPNDFTFHSLRRSSATAAADAGATVQQMMEFYGWQNTNMPQEYVSTSKAAVKTMAEKLSNSNCLNSDGGDSVQSFNSLASKQSRVYEKAEKVVIIENFSGNFTM